MRATAFEPPPPTPTTLIRAPFRLSSCSSYFSRSNPVSSNDIFRSFFLVRIAVCLHLPQHPRQNTDRLALQLALHFQSRRIHGQTRGGSPGRIVYFRRPILDPDRQTIARLAFQYALGDVARAAQLPTAAGEDDPSDQRPFHAHAREFAPHIIEKLARTRFENFV